MASNVGEQERTEIALARSEGIHLAHMAALLQQALLLMDPGAVKVAYSIVIEPRTPTSRVFPWVGKPARSTRSSTVKTAGAFIRLVWQRMGLSEATVATYDRAMIHHRRPYHYVAVTRVVGAVDAPWLLHDSL